MRQRFLFLGLALTLLAGCAGQTRPDPARGAAEAQWAKQRASLQQITQFNLQGRLASGGAMGLAGGMRWQQNADGSFDMHLSGPFGAGAVSVAGTADQVTVRTREGEQTTNDPQGWIRQKTGWMLPLAELRWWAVGLPAPQTEAQIELDREGRLLSLLQDGWRIDYREYQEVGTLALPRKFEAANGDARVRVVADRWTNLPETP